MLELLSCSFPAEGFIPLDLPLEGEGGFRNCLELLTGTFVLFLAPAILVSKNTVNNMTIWHRCICTRISKLFDFKKKKLFSNVMFFAKIHNILHGA